MRAMTLSFLVNDSAVLAVDMSAVVRKKCPEFDAQPGLYWCSWVSTNCIVEYVSKNKTLAFLRIIFLTFVTVMTHD